MKEYYQKIEETLEQNLIDAGCSRDFIREFVELEKEQDLENQFCMLRMHRFGLLDQLHDAQKKIDCLDYLIYKMRKR